MQHWYIYSSVWIQAWVTPKFLGLYGNFSTIRFFMQVLWKGRCLFWKKLISMRSQVTILCNPMLSIILWFILFMLILETFTLIFYCIVLKLNNYMKFKTDLLLNYIHFFIDWYPIVAITALNGNKLAQVRNNIHQFYLPFLRYAVISTFKRMF